MNETANSTHKIKYTYNASDQRIFKRITNTLDGSEEPEIDIEVYFRDAKGRELATLTQNSMDFYFFGIDRVARFIPSEEDCNKYSVNILNQLKPARIFDPRESILQYPVNLTSGILGGNQKVYFLTSYLNTRDSLGIPIANLTSRKTIEVDNESSFNRILNQETDAAQLSLRVIYLGGVGGPVVGPFDNPGPITVTDIYDPIPSDCHCQRTVSEMNPWQYYDFNPENDPLSLPETNCDGQLKGDIIYYLYDHLSNTRMTYKVTNSTVAGNLVQAFHVESIFDYDPYGKIMRSYTTTPEGEKYMTTQHERDAETGLDYRGARFYDCEVGRFLSVDPLATKYPSLNAFSYVGGMVSMAVDPDGREPIKPLTGTIDQALSNFQANNINTIEGINNFFAKPVDKSGKAIKEYVRYVYTSDNGWIDLRHYFASIANTETIMDMAEVTQCMAGYSSCYSYEDLPSNAFGSESPVRKDGVTGAKLKSGQELFDSILKHFDEAGATSPINAPNFENLPIKERPKVPDNATDGRRLEVWEKQWLISTGNFVPQNYTEMPFDLTKFPRPSKKYLE